jgi:hypothetical protein
VEFCVATERRIWKLLFHSGSKSGFWVKHKTFHAGLLAARGHAMARKSDCRDARARVFLAEALGICFTRVLAANQPREFSFIGTCGAPKKSV